MATQGDRKTFRNEDLVLRVTTAIDPAKWDDSRYEAFLDELCETREYQKDAIRTTLRYLLGGRYPSLRELARENFDRSDEIKQRYGSFANMERHLQLPNQLSGSIDLATGTGKSYVLYGIAAILLAHGVVDRVLVLCPSNTIEAGLLEKFRDLAGRVALREALPPEAKVQAPRIIDASETITSSSICVENYHAILEHVKSSIRDSLTGQGTRTAVLCDEAHHVANETTEKVGKWKGFLLDPAFGFRFVIGVSGTCYVGDDYFADVLSRYSIRQAIEQRFVKQIEYVAEDPQTSNADERWQLIHNRHRDWTKKLQKRGIRPLTIIVAKGIADCKRIASELQDFLVEWEKIALADAEEKVLVVTSAKEHSANVAKLASVDSQASRVEWIVSVSMLSEGWDVKNVFQIVPHEERAFNSKLLIAQVLGRGLRVPPGWTGEPPLVTVFNHDAWAGRIRHLVNEVLEIERRLSSSVVPDSEYHFDLHNINYTRQEDVSEYAKNGEYKLLERGYVELPTQVETEDVTVDFEHALTGERKHFKTKIQHKTYSVDEVAEHIFQRLRSIDEESQHDTEAADRTTYSTKYPVEWCKKVVEASLSHAKVTSQRVTEENRQKLLQALGTLRRTHAKRVVYALTPMALVTINTRTRQSDSCSAGDLRRGDRTVFFGPSCEATLLPTQAEFFREVADPDGEYRAGCEAISSVVDFKTPLNLAIADAQPERKFIRQLCQRANTLVLDAWLKSTAQKFYWIEYAWKKGEHTKRAEFSPDFFIKKGESIFVVEVKGDEEIADPSPENQKKFEYASKHFAQLNEWLKDAGSPIRYQLNFVTPRDFGKFFQTMRDTGLQGFRSELDVALGGASNK